MRRCIRKLVPDHSHRWRQEDPIHAMFILDVSVVHCLTSSWRILCLHLLFRIGDVLTRNLILHADSCDHRNRAHRGVVTSHIRELESAIQSCGVSFQILQKREANGKPIPGSYDWTALTRKHKLVVLKWLPDKLSTLLPSHLCPVVVQLWKVSLDNTVHVIRFHCALS